MSAWPHGEDVALACAAVDEEVPSVGRDAYRGFEDLRRGDGGRDDDDIELVAEGVGVRQRVCLVRSEYFLLAGEGTTLLAAVEHRDLRTQVPGVHGEHEARAPGADDARPLSPQRCGAA